MADIQLFRMRRKVEIVIYHLKHNIDHLYLNKNNSSPNLGGNTNKAIQNGERKMKIPDLRKVWMLMQIRPTSVGKRRSPPGLLDTNQI